MTSRKPLVLVDGQIMQLPEGDEIEMPGENHFGVFLGGNQKDAIKQVGNKTYLKAGKLWQNFDLVSLTDKIEIGFEQESIYPGLFSNNSNAITRLRFTPGELQILVNEDIISSLPLDPNYSSVASPRFLGFAFTDTGPVLTLSYYSRDEVTELDTEHLLEVRLDEDSRIISAYRAVIPKEGLYVNGVVSGLQAALCFTRQTLEGVPTLVVRVLPLEEVVL